MKDFFKMFFAALAAIFVYSMCSLVLYFVMMIVMLGMGGSMSSKTNVEDNSVLQLDLNTTITERSVSQGNVYELVSGSFSMNKSIGMDDILRGIKAAKTDSKISAIYLNLSSIPTDFANLQNIRNALLDFAESGKPIYAWAESYNLSTYYIASTATKIYMRQFGGIEITGIASQSMFYKPLLDKLGIDMQVIRHGKFKSAVEPFLQGSMSDANRLQTTTLVNDIWNTLANDICKSKNITVSEFDNYIDNLTFYSDVEKCVSANMIDALVSHQQAEDSIKAAIGVDDFNETLKTVSLTSYISSLKDLKPQSSKIAIIYAEGEINPNGKEHLEIKADDICAAFQSALDDDDIKAAVFRINSPGGSASESEEIYQFAKKFVDKKPLVVSMGNYAASGGYYIASPATKIVAMPSTITGSIGVFGLIPNLEKMLKDIELNVETVGTNKHSGMGSLLKKMDSSELEVVQQSIEQVYNQFISHVAEGRGITTAQVDSIGQGRVWSGVSALKIGLVDTLGSLNDALDIAAKLADVSDYSIIGLPVIEEESLDKLLRSFLTMEIFATENPIPKDLLPLVKEYNSIKNMSGIQCRMEPLLLEY